MLDQLDEGDFTPEDFYEIRKVDSDDELIRESGCQTDEELNKFIDDWFYSGFWTSPRSSRCTNGDVLTLNLDS